jgi:hypothetical protein
VRVTVKRGVPPLSEPVWRIAIPFGVWLVLDLAASTAAFRTFGSTWFQAVSPGASPPWYFIGQDLVEAVWASGAAVLMVAFSIVAARSLGPSVWAALGVAQIGFIGKLGGGANVLLHTRNVWQRADASSDWATYDAYVRSQRWAFDASLVLGILVAVVCMWQYRRALRGTTEVR